MMHRVFTYGSLKKGFHNHSKYLTGARYMGEWGTPPMYTMYDMEYYPAVTPDGNTSIVGEVWEIDDATLKAIDELEGHPYYYERQLLNTSKYGVVWMYIMREAYAKDCDKISNGMWEHK